MTPQTVKMIRVSIFALAALAFLAVPLSIAYRYHTIQKEGESFTFRVEGYDPYAPMLGRFVRIRLQPATYRFADEAEAERTVRYSYRQEHPLYLEFTADNNGLAKISKVSTQVPATRSYWKITNYYRYNAELNITYPLNRVYMNEYRAPQWEKQLADRKVKTTAVIRLQDGIGVLDKIEIKP